MQLNHMLLKAINKLLEQLWLDFWPFLLAEFVEFI